MSFVCLCTFALKLKDNRELIKLESHLYVSLQKFDMSKCTVLLRIVQTPVGRSLPSLI